MKTALAARSGIVAEENAQPAPRVLHLEFE
jgi:hypothetical protein